MQRTPWAFSSAFYAERYAKEGEGARYWYGGMRRPRHQRSCPGPAAQRGQQLPAEKLCEGLTARCSKP